MKTPRHVLSVIGVLVLAFVATGLAQADPPTVLYRLSGSSGFLSGCIEGPCLCPVSLGYMAGTFGLTPDPTQGPQAYSIDGIDWFTHWNGAVLDQISGAGHYFIDGENHRIVLTLQVNGGSPFDVDSGFVVRGSEFPAIDISALTDDFCFQEGVIVEAAPSAYSIDLAMPNTTSVVWTVEPDAVGYDAVHGTLNDLRASGGNFTDAGMTCLGNDIQGTAVEHNAPLAPGEGVFFVVRGLPGPGYDSDGPGQAEPRDEEIDQSAEGCP